MEIKVGDYVRTDNGIAKCIDIDKNNGDYVFDKSIFYELDCQRTHILYKYYLQDEIDDGMKISPNIIDLIEVGDYVNGIKVDFMCPPLKVFLDGEEYLEDEIKSIVTKEQFSQMEYKINE